jgi:hypothetical protein
MSGVSGWLDGLIQVDQLEEQVRANAEAYAREKVKAERGIGFRDAKPCREWPAGWRRRAVRDSSSRQRVRWSDSISTAFATRADRVSGFFASSIQSTYAS